MKTLRPLLASLVLAACSVPAASACEVAFWGSANAETVAALNATGYDIDYNPDMDRLAASRYRVAIVHVRGEMTWETGWRNEIDLFMNRGVPSGVILLHHPPILAGLPSFQPLPWTAHQATVHLPRPPSACDGSTETSVAFAGNLIGVPAGTPMTHCVTPTSQEQLRTQFVPHPSAIVDAGGSSSGNATFLRRQSGPNQRSVTMSVAPGPAQPALLTDYLREAIEWAAFTPPVTDWCTAGTPSDCCCEESSMARDIDGFDADLALQQGTLDALVAATDAQAARLAELEAAVARMEALLQSLSTPRLIAPRTPRLPTR